MLKRKLLIPVAILILSSNLYSSLTKEDLKEIRNVIREELKYVDVRLESIEKRMDGIDKRMDSIDKRMDSLERRIEGIEADLRWMIGLVFAGMFSIIGFVLWDRRTALAPAIRRTEDLSLRGANLEKALIEYSKTQPKLLEILRDLKIL